MPEPWSVYIVRCGDGRLYTGIAKDPKKRFEHHRAGNGALFTRLNGVVELIGSKMFASRAEAARVERALKKMDPARKQDWARQNIQIEPNRG
jgi:putative endonuclease